MSFDKNDYKMKRSKGERGQGKVDRVFYPKGTPVPEINGVVILNGAGENLVRQKGQGLTYLNRAESRRVSRSHPATKKNYNYQKDKNGFHHMAMEPNHRITLPTKATYTGNHLRHREAQIARELKHGQ